MNREPLTVAISSRALFDLGDSNRVYEEEGLEAYREYQIAHEEEKLAPGDAFPLVKKLLNINELLGRPAVEVILLSRNSADTGLRIFNSIQEHGLDITRAAFSGGDRPYRYVQPFACALFLSTEPEDVARALQDGVAAATLLGRPRHERDTDKLRIAFDGDAVLFAEDAAQVYEQQGLEAFAESEKEAAEEPLGGGPFKPFLAGLQALQQEFGQAECPIRTALVTARGAPAHKRVIKTLRAWDIRLDESLFLGGKDKGAFLEAFGADVFFDDQARNCENTVAHAATGHVPRGVVAAPESPGERGAES